MSKTELTNFEDLHLETQAQTTSTFRVMKEMISDEITKTDKIAETN